MTSLVRRGFVDSIAKVITSGYSTSPATILELTPDTTGSVARGITPNILFSTPVSLHPLTVGLTASSVSPTVTFIGGIDLSPVTSNSIIQSPQPQVNLTVLVELNPVVTRITTNSPRPIADIGRVLISEHTIDYSSPIMAVEYAPVQVTLTYNTE